MIEASGYSYEVEEINSRANVLIWCLDKDSSPNLIRIPYFYNCHVELGPLICSRRRCPWNEDLVIKLINSLYYSCDNIAPVSVHFAPKQKLYYYSGKRKYAMAQLTFNNIKGIEKLRDSCNNFSRRDNNSKKSITFEVKHGAKIISLNTQISLWEDRHSPIRHLMTKSNVGYAQWFEIKVKEITNRKISTVKEWEGDYKTMKPRPDITLISSPKVFSFDIECYSDNHRALPKQCIPAHVVFMISCIIFRVGKPEREKYLIALGDIDIPGVNVIKAESEMDLCTKFAELIIEKDPDMLTGFNIFGFDFPYLYERKGLYGEAWPNISRKINGVNRLIEINWKSSAYSRQRYCMMDASGRINFDLFTLVRREMKLLRYNLDTVSKELLGRGKHDVSPQDMFRIYEGYVENPSKYKEELEKVALYCVEDSMLVVDLIEKLNVWIWLSEFSSVTGVSIADLFIRGQQVRCYSLLQNLLINENMVMDKIPMSNEGYTGAFVGDPIPGIYDYVACLDFNSLYPNIIRDKNMCYTTLVKPEDEKELKEEDLNIIEWTEVDDKGKEKNFRYVFVKEHVRESLLKRLLTNLINTRKAVRVSIKDDPCPISCAVKDKKQLALKVVANSTYGFTGVQKGMLPCLPIASSVTAMGRKYIQKCNEIIKDKYGYDVVYNDTDSVFFVIKAGNYKEALEKGKQLEKEVSDMFPEHLNLELEKVGRMLCIKKKMYAFWSVDKDGNLVPKEKIMHKGIVLNRRDNCLWQRQFYEKILMNCMERKGIQKMLDIIAEEVIGLYSRNFSWDKFVIVKGVGEEYKTDTYPMHIFKENMADRECPVNAGDRVDFVICKKNTRYLGEKMMAPEHFLNDKARIDYDYYLEHYGMKSIEMLFNIIYGKEVEITEEKHKEKCVHKALVSFISKYGIYAEACYKICCESKSFKEGYEKLYAMMEQRRIGKHRQELKRTVTHMLKQSSVYICKKPVKQQYALILQKRKCCTEIKEKGFELFRKQYLKELLEKVPCVY